MFKGEFEMIAPRLLLGFCRFRRVVVRVLAVVL
jgi:hypothetical protein